MGSPPFLRLLLQLEVLLVVASATGVAAISDFLAGPSSTDSFDMISWTEVFSTGLHLLASL